MATLIIQTGLKLLSTSTNSLGLRNIFRMPTRLKLQTSIGHKFPNYCTSTTSTNDLVTVNFVLKDGSRKTIQGKCGQHVMELAQENDIDIEGACAASLACSTCHVYVSFDYFKKLEPPEDLEEDMLDQAPFLKENSRLSCQIILSKELEGIEITLPPATRNFYVDGKTPTAHH